MDDLVGKVVRAVEGLGEPYVTTDFIGEQVRRRLATVDDVAAIRSASVFKGFESARDFSAYIANFTR